MSDDILLKLISDVKEQSNTNKVQVLPFDIKVENYTYDEKRNCIYDKNTNCFYYEDGNFIYDENSAIKTLNCLIGEMNRRNYIIRSRECRNILEYNKKFEGNDNLFAYLLLFNNYQSISNESIKKAIELLAQNGRSAGIYMLLECDKLNLFSEERV